MIVFWKVMRRNHIHSIDFMYDRDSCHRDRKPDGKIICGITIFAGGCKKSS